jgi:hypothetical protein
LGFGELRPYDLVVEVADQQDFARAAEGVVGRAVPTVLFAKISDQDLEGFPERLGAGETA